MCQFLMIFYGPKEAPGVKELGQKSPEPSTRVEGAPLSRGWLGYPLPPWRETDAKNSYKYINPQKET